MANPVLAVGTYDRVVCGFAVPPPSDSGDVVPLKLVFCNEAHTSNVKAVASAGKWLVSGGADEVIK